MMERWNIGHEKQNTDYPIKMLNLLFLMMLTGIYFLVFSGKIRHQKKKINQIIYVLNTGPFKPILPRFHYAPPCGG
jgi:hypothetical protein